MLANYIYNINPEEIHLFLQGLMKFIDSFKLYFRKTENLIVLRF